MASSYMYIYIFNNKKRKKFMAQCNISTAALFKKFCLQQQLYGAFAWHFRSTRRGTLDSRAKGMNKESAWESFNMKKLFLSIYSFAYAVFQIILWVINNIFLVLCPILPKIVCIFSWDKTHLESAPAWLYLLTDNRVGGIWVNNISRKFEKW